MYGECWFTGKFYFKHGGSQNATLSPSTLPGERDALHLLPAKAALPQIRVDTLIGPQANYEIKYKITIYFYKIIISYEQLKNRTYINTKSGTNSNLQLFIK